MCDKKDKEEIFRVRLMYVMCVFNVHRVYLKGLGSG